MSALGQKQTSLHVRVMSALPPKADIGTQSWNVRFVPKADISDSALNEFQEVLVDRVGVGGEHAMREARIELHSGFLEELDLKQGSAFVRNDLVVFALHDKVSQSSEQSGQP